MNVLNISLGIMGMNEWVIIAVIVLLLFGGRKIPELMKGLGGGIKEFKKATKEEDNKKEEETK
ncbi:twin-arginine translocase TatA/TatE family subunit [Wenyingzhuangia sp. chi5]|uniref:Sec-independent protein translocase protein TatA n=1 Tax=Wenyingzhuangia gilva TaxID=3057677 RepID=A0ABT8VPV4_9FLAO|nr:twin-arginine translocase TatA/TatE family subunit [Wenyingzhuangia sp. chi5]MDO3694010.1 twin-arginine translocase TatA/TatE family subunit [Wenyingzhuangia sp. chi5]